MGRAQGDNKMATPQLPPEIVALQKEMQGHVESYKAAQADNQKLVAQRTQLHQQSSENQMVLKELNLLEDEAAVFKLVGPVLIPQDLIEAKANVQKRLDYMKGETDKIEAKMKGANKEMNDIQQKVVEKQAKMQEMAKKAAQAG